MEEQNQANKARIYGYVIGIVAVAAMLAWKLLAR